MTAREREREGGGNRSASYHIRNMYLTRTVTPPMITEVQRMDREI